MGERDKDVLEDALAVNNNHLVLIYLHDVKVVSVILVWMACVVLVQSVMELHELATGRLLDTFPIEMGCVSSITGKRNQNEVENAVTVCVCVCVVCVCVCVCVCACACACVRVCESV